MPGLVPTRRARSSLDVDVDESSQGEVDTPQPNKRARTTPEVDRRTTTDSWNLDTPKTVSRQRQLASRSRPNVGGTKAGGFRSQPEHQPGAIVRVTLKNFVTYSNATFFPGPSLNMVIGPNGTGKSTLVCAICLGLGWSPKHLGRAKDAVEFIKHGAEKATIEIELKGNPGKTNSVIKRQIDHHKTGNHWWVNGQASSEKQVRGTAESFNIQIDNLCQFLPQDRVAEFANLKPVEKLAATIRAAAPYHMTEEHEKLKSLRAEQKEAEKDICGHRGQLQNLEGRQNAQRADVERVIERQQVLEEIKFLELRRPAAEYVEALGEFRNASKHHSDAEIELDKLKQEVEPSMRAVNDKTHYEERISKVLTQRQNTYQRSERAASEIVKRMEGLSRNLKDCENKREAEKKAQTSRKGDIARILVTIKGLENTLRNEPPNFDGAAWNEKIRSKRREKNEVELSRRELDDERAALLEEFGQKKDRIEGAKRDMEGLKTEVGQRGQLLQRISDHVFKAWEWVKENQDATDSDGRKLFQGRIYGPAMLECSVKEEKWTPAIESLFQQSELLAITCTNNTDFKTLSDMLHGKLNLPGVPLRTSLTPLEQRHPPVNEAEMRRLGIAGWALDYLEGPAPILSMLCNERSVHKTAVLEKEESSEQHEELTNSAVDAWLTMNKSTRTTRRREYNVVSVRTQNIQKEARYWASQPIDQAAIANLQDNIEGWQSELDALQARGIDAGRRLKASAIRVKELQDEELKLENDKAEEQKAFTAFQGLPAKIRTQKDRLEDFQNQEAASHDRLAEIADEEGTHAVAKGQLAIDYANIVYSLRQLHSQIVEAAIAQLEARSDIGVLKARNADIERLLAGGTQRVEELRSNKASKKSEAQRLRTVMQKTWADNPELQKRMEELSDEERERKPQELDLQIESRQARLELLHGGSSSILQEFEERARKIERLRAQINTHDSKLAELAEAISSIRSTWEPALDAVIAQISDAFGAFFKRINCAGEVTVFKPSSEANSNDGADFENWAIHLLVKFRENEPLSLLDSHRQSGGERAVSTMFYLMALQRLSKAPFRVVDEINQGMDPRNERVVHEMMVDIACGNIRAPRATGSDEVGHPDEDNDEEQDVGSQYFLITPKLLTNLKYKPGMKVHCIASGEYMPRNPDKLDLKKLITFARGASGTNLGEGGRTATGARELSVSA